MWRNKMSLEREIAEMIIEALNMEDISLDNIEEEVPLLFKDINLDPLSMVHYLQYYKH
jgi:hypothetical protein